MIDIIREQSRQCVRGLYEIVLRVQDDHESGDYDAERVYCKKCGPPVEYPCAARQWAERVEETAPESVKAMWRGDE